jgi:hypothetical protein
MGGLKTRRRREAWRRLPSALTARWHKLQKQMPSARAGSTQTTRRSGPAMGTPKKRLNLDGLDDQAGNGRPETRSTKVQTKSGHGFSVETVNKDVSSGDDFSLASRDEIASAGIDDTLDDEAAGAALRTLPTGAVAGGRRLCLCCLLAETPRTYWDTPEALPVFYRAVQRAPAAQRWPGGLWAGCSTTQPQWPCWTNCTERSPAGVKRPEGPRTTSLTRRTTTRTSTRIKRMTEMTRPAMPSLSPLPQSNGLNNDAMYNNMSRAALQLDRCRRA